MAELNFTGGSVLTVASNGRIADADLPLSGSAITAGFPVYLDVTTNTIKPADTSTAAKANVIGIALNGCPGAGQPITLATRGTLTVNAALTAGLVYVLGTNSVGHWMPSADLDAAVAGTYCTLLGVALSTTTISLCIMAAGVAK